MKKREVERLAVRYAAAILQGEHLLTWAEKMGVTNARDSAIFLNKVNTLGNQLARRVPNNDGTYVEMKMRPVDTQENLEL